MGTVKLGFTDTHILAQGNLAYEHTHIRIRIHIRIHTHKQTQPTSSGISLLSVCTERGGWKEWTEEKGVMMERKEGRKAEGV